MRPRLFHVHWYRFVRQAIPPYSAPSPTNPFRLELWARKCRCGKTKGPW